MKPEKNVLKGIVMITQIGISMIVPIFLCLFAGRWIDQKFQVNYWTIIGIVLGIAAAVRNIYIMTKQFYAKDKAKEDLELKYMNDMKQERENKKMKG